MYIFNCSILNNNQSINKYIFWNTVCFIYRFTETVVYFPMFLFLEGKSLFTVMVLAYLNRNGFKGENQH